MKPAFKSPMPNAWLSGALTVAGIFAITSPLRGWGFLLNLVGLLCLLAAGIVWRMGADHWDDILVCAKDAGATPPREVAWEDITFEEEEWEGTPFGEW